MRRILPASCPLFFSRSSLLSNFTRISFERTGPSVPGVHALGSAINSAVSGDTIRTLDFSYDHPVPNGPQASRCELTKPQSVNCFCVHLLALRILGEFVRRGPMPSVIALSVSISFEFLNSS